MDEPLSRLVRCAFGRTAALEFGLPGCQFDLATARRQVGDLDGAADALGEVLRLVPGFEPAQRIPRELRGPAAP